MKKLIIKRFEPGSAFKAVLMAMAIPFLIFFGLLASITILSGFASGGFGSRFAYIMFSFLFMPVMYGLIAMLLAASYNWLAPKFGGLEIEAEDNDTEEAVANMTRNE